MSKHTEPDGTGTDDDLLTSIDLGFVTATAPSIEQQHALTFAHDRLDADLVDFRDPESVDSLGEYDVLWWHRDDPLEAVDETTIERLQAYLDGGGRLLLGLYAMAAVDDLGIDPHPPDRIVDAYMPIHKWGQRPAGHLVKDRFADEPIADGFDGHEIHTQDSVSETAPEIAYEHRIPKRGTVLASMVIDGEQIPQRNSVVAWNGASGTAIGIGAFCAFGHATEAYEARLETVLENAVHQLLSLDDCGPIARPYGVDGLQSIRTALAEDHHRPSYHFAPPANWLNDPNGLVKWDGQYHLFYQYNPGGPYHGSIHWGHAVSDDLVTWRDEPVALKPEMNGPDRHGCWSGCTVVDDEQPYFVYTGGSGDDQLPCVAKATDDSLRSWEKSSENPVIERPPDDPPLLSNDEWNAEFRDHDVWKEGDSWYQLIGSGVEGGGGAALLYRSTDLSEWEYRGAAFVGDRIEDGPMWECPDLLDFGDQQVLQVSNYDDAVYYVGSFEDERFTPDHSGVVDHGSYYAAQSLYDDGGDRYLAWGWIREDRDDAAQWEAGWSGAMSVPREMRIDDDGRLEVRPASELSAIRDEKREITDYRLTPDERPFDGLGGAALDVEIEFELEAGSVLELGLAEAPDGSERTLVRYESDALVVDRSSSSQSPHAADDPVRIDDAPSADDGPVELRALIDGSVIELFVDGRTCLSTRVYPTDPDSTGVSLTVTEGSATVYAATVAEMARPDDRRSPSTVGQQRGRTD